MFLLFVVIAWVIMGSRLANWSRWASFYPTIQYFIIFNLLYNFLYYNKTLWAYQPVSLKFLNHTLIDITFTFIIVPITIAIYLTHYPEQNHWLQQGAYIIAWSLLYWVIEYFFFSKGMFIYDNGWNLGWTAFFNLIMFSFIKLHSKRPLVALGWSVPVTLFLMLFFPPDLHTMK